MLSPVLYQQGNDGITVYAIPLSILIITLYVLSSFGIHEYKRKNRGSAPCCHESSVATILGVILGGVLKLFRYIIYHHYYHYKYHHLSSILK